MAGESYEAYSFSAGETPPALKWNKGPNNDAFFYFHRELPGMVKQWAGGNDPATGNWLICDGRAISRTTYSDLFAVIGTTYGAGDGSTTFNIPNIKGKVVIGYNSEDAYFNALGKKSNEKTYSIAHTHGNTNWTGDHYHWVGGETGVNSYRNVWSDTYSAYITGNPAHVHSWGANSTTNGGHAHTTGAMSAHASITPLPPYMVLNHIIKA